MNRSLRSWTLALCLAAVAVGVAAGSPLNRKISGDLPDYADLHPYLDVTISPDSRYAVYASDERVDDFYELYSVPLDGSRAPVRVSGPTQIADVYRMYWQISPDNRRVVYQAEESRLTGRQLYSVPIEGGPKVRLSPGPPAANWVDDFVIAPDGERAVLFTDGGMFSVPIEGGEAVRLGGINIPNLTSVKPAAIESGKAAPLTAADASYSPITADSKTVVYVRYDEASASSVLYSVPITGGSPVQLSEGAVESWKLYEDSEGASRVAFFARDEMGRRSLYTVRASGGDPVRITSQIDGQAYRFLFTICANGQTAVFESGMDSGQLTLASVSLSADEPITLAVDMRMDGYGDSRYAVSPDCSSVVYGAGDGLFVVPTVGGSPKRVAYACSPAFTFSPDSKHMVYSGRESPEQPCEVWALDLAAKTSVRMNASLPRGGAVERWSHRITPDSQAVLYVAEQEYSDVAELFMASFDGADHVKFSGPMTFGGNVTGSPVLSPDGRHVVYVADQERDEVHELFATALESEASANTYLPLVQR